MLQNLARTRTTVQTGIQTRTQVVANSLSRFARQIKAHVPLNSDLEDAVNNMTARVTEKLIKSVDVYLYSGDRIALHMVAIIDWEESEFRIVADKSYFVGGDDYVTDSMADFLDRVLPNFLTAVKRHTPLTGARCTYSLSDEAIAKFGHEEALHKANLAPVGAADRQHFASFRPFAPGVSPADTSLPELRFGVWAGSSSRRPGARRWWRFW